MLRTTQRPHWTYTENVVKLGLRFWETWTNRHADMLTATLRSRARTKVYNASFSTLNAALAWVSIMIPATWKAMERRQWFLVINVIDFRLIVGYEWNLATLGYFSIAVEKMATLATSPHVAYYVLYVICEPAADKSRSTWGEVVALPKYENWNRKEEEGREGKLGDHCW